MKAFMSVGQTPSTRAVLCAPYQAHYEKMELQALLAEAEPDQVPRAYDTAGSYWLIPNAAAALAESLTKFIASF